VTARLLGCDRCKATGNLGWRPVRVSVPDGGIADPDGCTEAWQHCTCHPSRQGAATPRRSRPQPARQRSADTPAQVRIRRQMEALLAKAASTSFAHEAAACRDKAEHLRREYGL